MTVTTFTPSHPPFGLGRRSARPKVLTHQKTIYFTQEQFQVLQLRAVRAGKLFGVYLHDLVVADLARGEG